MRIAFRPSGGRGEYELVGRQAGILSADLFGLELCFQIAPNLTIPGRSTARMLDGKPRIRLENSSSDHHAYRLFAAVLLLPDPRRELRLASGSEEDFVRDGRYRISDIDVDVVSTTSTSAFLRPTKLWLQNAAGAVRAVEVAPRMALISATWEAARGRQGALAGLVRAHEEAAHSADHGAIQRAAVGLRNHVPTDGDTLASLLQQLDVTEDAVPLDDDGVVSHDSIEDETDPGDARRREVAKWRRQAVRTAAGRRFAREVQALYGNRCVVSGARLPKLDAISSPGVDAAHILPWARFDLNSVTNGLCLNKLCHWAFDAGVIRLEYIEGVQRYSVSIPRTVEQQAADAGIQLDYFAQFVGYVPEDQLPADPALRPSPRYLARLNEELYD